MEVPTEVPSPPEVSPNSPLTDLSDAVYVTVSANLGGRLNAVLAPLKRSGLDIR